MNLYCRKDGRWEGRIPRGKKKNGKRKFQYIISRNKEDVISRINMIRQSEQNYQSCYKTLDAIFYEWFNTVKYHIKESTASNYRMKAEKHILPSFGEKLIDSLNLADSYGEQTAVVKTLVVNVRNHEGLEILLSPQKGQGVISGLKVKKIR